MANVAHSGLTAANLHEPKGAATASAGQVYVANGAGSGAWTSISGLIITGQIADWCTPIAPSGWLECDGSDISIVTYAALYNAMTIQQTGNRSAGSAIITGLAATNNISPGYFVFGTGIASGTTVLTVDSATQITMSANASSTGSSTVIVSPYLLNTGTIRLPDLKTAGRYRRSRSATLRVGQQMNESITNHTHAAGTLANSAAGAHGHIATEGLTGAGHSHSNIEDAGGLGTYRAGSVTPGGGLTVPVLGGGGNSIRTSSSSEDVVGGIGIEVAPDHTHTISGSTAAQSGGGTETRPITHVFLTCVKT